MCASPYTDTELPRRENERSDSAEPQEMKSKALQQLAMRAMPYTERLDPIRPKLRRETVDPKLA
jgi:hypothetical protein